MALKALQKTACQVRRECNVRRLILLVALILTGCSVQPPPAGIPAPGTVATPAPTIAPTIAPTEVPAAAAPQVIDPTLNFALQVLRTTPTGETLYSWFLEVAPSLTFGVTGLSESWSGFYREAPQNEIVINETLQNEPPEVLAALITWQIVMAFNAKRDGTRSTRWLSVEDCLNEAVVTERYMVRWWNEKFGDLGKRSASNRWEITLNERVGYYRNGTLETIIRSQPVYQDFCAQLVILRTPQDISLPRDILLLYFADKLNQGTDSADVQYWTNFYEYLTATASIILTLYIDAGHGFVVSDEFLFYASYLLVPDCVVQHLLTVADDRVVQQFGDLALSMREKWPNVQPSAMRGVLTTAAEREEGCIAFSAWIEEKT